MYESFQLNFEKYYSGGRKTTEWLLNLCRPFLDLEEATMLDWGCGPARIVRHLPDLLPGATVHGTDYNRKTIAWCKEAIPEVEFGVGKLAPPLEYPDAHFDLIYGISIFTHLSEANHVAWLTELARILKPGGVLFLTTQGDIFRQKLTPTEKTQYDGGSLVVRGGVKEGHRVYSAFQPPSYFRDLCKGQLTVQQHIPGAVQEWGLEQDVFILTSPIGQTN